MSDRAQQEARRYSIFVIVGLVIVWACYQPTDAQPKVHWLRKDCGTAECVTQALNAMRPEQAMAAKVVAYSSSRTIGGWFGDGYGIYYPQ